MLVDIVVQLLGSGIVAAGLKIWAFKAKVQADKDRRLMDMARAHTEQVKELAEIKDPQYRSTRKFIAISAVLTVMVGPKLSYLIDKSTVVMYPYLESGGSLLWGLLSSPQSMQWYALPGYVLTPVDLSIISLTVGFYMGSSVAGNMLK